MAMANLRHLVAATLLILVVSAINGNAQAPAPAVDCTNELINLADCLSFVQQGNKLDKPLGTCCSGLKKVVKEQVSCLCEAFKSSSNFGIPLNLTKALSLPTACGVFTPPLSKCNISVGGVPGAAPAPSPANYGTPFPGSRAHMALTPSPAPSHSNALAAIDRYVGSIASAAALVIFMYLT